MVSIRHLDFAMLMAFDLLMRELNVSRAAEKMYVTQSAMSHILQRLRQQFDDPLLVKTPTGMKPTRRAEDLVESVGAILRDAEHLLLSSSEFDPAMSQHQFVIGGSNYIEFLVLPKLVARIRQLAPGIEIRVTRAEPDVLASQFANNELDLALGFEAMMNLPKYVLVRRLFEDTVVCIERKSGDTCKDLSLEDYLQRSQLVISSCDVNAVIVARALANEGLERRVALVVPNFLSAPFTVATTDLLLSLPRRIAESCVNFAPLRILDMPLDLPPYDVVMAWHPAREKDPAHAWLRSHVQAVGDEIACEGKGCSAHAVPCSGRTFCPQGVGNGRSSSSYAADGRRRIDRPVHSRLLSPALGVALARRAQ